MSIQNLLYILAGSLTGLMSGILGIGGGIIVVPALLFIFHFDPKVPNILSMHMAAGSSLAVMLFTSLAAVIAHYRIEPILWWVYQRLWLGIVLGTIFGALLATQLSTEWLRVLFACFLMGVGYKMLIHHKHAEVALFPPDWLNRILSFLIGLQSGLLGVGGGVLIVPYLTYCGIDPRKIAPISSLCTMTVALIGTLTFIISTHNMITTHYTTGYIYWPAVIWVALSSVAFAPVGARLSYRLPLHIVRYIFVMIIFITAIGLLL